MTFTSNSRRNLITTIVGSTLWPLATAANPRTLTIAMVVPHEDQSTERGFKSALEKSGMNIRYVSVRNHAGISAEALRAQVLATQPDLIYSWGTPTTLALAGKVDEPYTTNSLTHIPIVFTEVTDPVAAGLLRSLNDPSRNLTGVSHVPPLPVQMNAMLAYRPFKRIGYLHNPAEPNSAIILKNLREIAPSYGFDVIEAQLPVDAIKGPNPADIAPKVAELVLQKADLLYVGPITFLAFTQRDAVTQAAMHHKLPTFCTTESIVRKSGCLFGLFSNDANVGRFAASMAQEILSGQKKAQQIPAATLQRFSLLVNMQTAHALELYPPMLLLNVAEVINAPKTVSSQ